VALGLAILCADVMTLNSAGGMIVVFCIRVDATVQNHSGPEGLIKM